MKIRITESQLKKLIKEVIEEYVDEANYPTSWNIEEFKKLTSFSQRLQYCKTHLTPIASGSGRYTFGIDNETVLKLAKNKKGVAQNEAEYSFSMDGYNDGIIANVEDCDENYLWIEMEKMNKCTPNKFKAITGVSIDDFNDCLRYFNAQMSNTRREWFRKPVNYDDIIGNNEYFQRVVDVMQAFDMSPGDLGRLSSYGVTSDGQIKIVDAGLSSAVYDGYYS